MIDLRKPYQNIINGVENNIIVDEDGVVEVVVVERDSAVEKYSEFTRDLDEKQTEALLKAMDSNNEITFINGKAGSGKSHTALKISEALNKNGWLVSRVAPTGKAAKRVNGRTIHSWLEPEVEEDQWGKIKITGYRKEYFSDKECLIVDESSMIDQELWNELMRVFGNSNHSIERKIIFIGDEGQLDPVGDGTPFIDHLANQANVDLITTLDKIHRQKDGNDIVVFANAIRDGITLDQKFNNVAVATTEDAIKAVLNDFENNQILTPTNKGEHGTKLLNQEIQRRFNRTQKLIETKRFEKTKEGKWTKVKDIDIYSGDKIVVTKNHPAFGVTNGTTGIATRTGHETVVNFAMGMMFRETVPVLYFTDDTTGEELFLTIKFCEMNLDLAYALSVHKFQGSQCKNIYFMATPDNKWMLNQKGMKYTAVTRAEQMVYLILN